MPENNIDIGFQGFDEGLSQRIEDIKKRLANLSSAQDKHAQSLKKFGDAQKNVAAADEKLINMQQQMASRVALVTQKYKEQEGVAKKSIDTQSISWTNIASKIYVVQRAIQTLKKGYEFAKEGAQLEYQAEKFDRMAASVGTTAEILRSDMKEATRGTLSEFEAMTTASDLLSLGLVNNMNDAIRLATVQTALGMDTGELTLALANQTTRRFDQLGVSLNGFQDKLNTLKDTGMDVNQAFTEAFLQQAEEQMSRVGNIADGTAGSFKRLEASAKNFTDQMKIQASEGFAPAAEQLSKLIDKQTVYASELKRSGMEQKEFRQTAHEAGMSEVEFANYLHDTRIELQKSAVAVKGYDDAIIHAKSSVNAYEITQQQIAETQGKLNENNSSMLGVIMRAQSAQDSYRESLENLNAKMAELDQKYANHKISTKDYTEQMGELKDQVSATAEEFRKAGKEMAFSILLDKLKSGAEGFTDAEFEMALSTAENMGLIDKDTANMVINMNRHMTDMADGMVEPIESTLELKNTVHQLWLASGKTYVYTFKGIMEGDWPSTEINRARSGGRSGYGGGHAGPQPNAGGATGTDLIVPPGYANDTFLVGTTSGERVTVQTPAQQAQGGPGATVNIYAPVTMLVTKETADILDIK